MHGNFNATYLSNEEFCHKKHKKPQKRKCATKGQPKNYFPDSKPKVTGHFLLTGWKSGDCFQRPIGYNKRRNR